MSVHNQAIDYMKRFDDSMTAKEIAEGIYANTDTVRSALRTL